MGAAGLLHGDPTTSASSSVPAPDPNAFHPTELLWQLCLVLILIFINAFFAIAEYSLITVRSTRIQQLMEEGNRSAALVQKMKDKDHSTRMMATIQTGVTLISTLSSALAATSAVTPLAHWLRIHGPELLKGYASTTALLLITLPVAVISLVVGEIAPKSLAYRHSERFALIAVHPVAWLQTLLAPVVAALTFLSNLVLRPFGGTASFTAPVTTEEEIKILVDAGEQQGVLNPDEAEMVHSILDFGNTVARKVMTPRIDLTAYEVNAPMPGLITLISKSGHSRIPVYEGDLDNIVGIVHAKDLLDLPANVSRDAVPIRSVMRAPYFVPETKKVDELLREFRRSRQQLAIVRDEYGVTAGLVTIEDLLEEIVGDIQDEYDRDEPMVQVLDANVSILDGRVSLSDVNDRMDLDLPEDEADTIGGFVFFLLGHQAQQGERISYGDIDFVVEATDGRRVTKVRLIRHSVPSDPDDSAPHLPEEAAARNSGSHRDGQSARTVEVSGVESAP
jgi:putative hemolysin